jgi:hypothetical protein
LGVCSSKLHTPDTLYFFLSPLVLPTCAMGEFARPFLPNAHPRCASFDVQVNWLSWFDTTGDDHDHQNPANQFHNVTPTGLIQLLLGGYSY